MNKHYKPLLAAAAILASSALISCEKQEDARPGSSGELNPSLVYRHPTSSDEIKLVENLGKISTVLKELCKEPQNVKIMSAAVYAKAYTDESILLKDLIFPATSVLVKNKKFAEYCRKKKLDLTLFSSVFWKEADKINDPNFISFLKKLDTNNLASRSQIYQQEVSVYYPYSEVFQIPYEQEGGGYDYQPITSIVTATADADQAWGWQPYTDQNGYQQYREVLIDDDYAYNNPTLIVGVNGIEPYTEPTVANAVYQPSGPIVLPGIPRAIKQVHIGDLRCKKYYDALVSFTGNGGGNDMVFTRADGFLKVADGQVQADAFKTPQREVNRWHIRNKKFCAIDIQWDEDWEVDNKEQNIALYEEDNRNTSTINGSVKTTLKDPFGSGSTVEGNIGFTMSYKSDDNIIFQTNYKHDVFFYLNRINQGSGFYNGWPIRYGSSDDSFTLNDRTYIP